MDYSFFCGREERKARVDYDFFNWIFLKQDLCNLILPTVPPPFIKQPSRGGFHWLPPWNHEKWQKTRLRNVVSMIHPAQNRKHRAEMLQQRKEGRKEGKALLQGAVLRSSPASLTLQPWIMLLSLSKKDKCPRATAACSPDSSPRNVQARGAGPAKKTSHPVREPEDVHWEGRCIRQGKEDDGQPEFPTLNSQPLTRQYHKHLNDG